jgi:hypothetical protein
MIPFREAMPMDKNLLGMYVHNVLITLIFGTVAVLLNKWWVVLFAVATILTREGVVIDDDISNIP